MNKKEMRIDDVVNMIFTPLYTFPVSDLKKMGIVGDIECDESDYAKPYYEVLLNNNIANNLFNEMQIFRTGYSYRCNGLNIYITAPLTCKEEIDDFRKKSGIDIFNTIKSINNEIRNNPEFSNSAGFDRLISMVYYEYQVYKSGEYYGSFWTLPLIEFGSWFDSVLYQLGVDDIYNVKTKTRNSVDIDKVRRLVTKNDEKTNTIRNMVFELLKPIDEIDKQKWDS